MEKDLESMENYILTHFQEALDKGWICAFYQPIIRTITGCFAGVEALARWIDPVYGCIMPSVFVPVLEKSGKIWQLDCHILQEVLKLQRSRMDAGLQVGQISVNLSRMDFDHVDMLDFIREQVRRFRISKDLVCLEITENVLVQDKDRMIEVVRQLRASGFQIWMDDFGSGYSSLTFLNDYRLDVIKLDMEFLRSFNRTSREIIRSTIHMAKNLGIRTIAEGVERKDQVDFLKSIGCDMMQGWYFGKPCSQEAMGQYVLNMREKSEPIKLKRFYDRADAVIVETDVPMAVMEYDSRNFRYLYANDKQKEQLRTLGRKSLSDSEFVINNVNSPLHAKLIEFFDQAFCSRTMVTAYFPDNSRFVRIEGRLIDRKDTYYLIYLSLVNVTADRNNKEGIRRDGSLTDVDLLFEDIHIFDMRNGTASPLLTNMQIPGGMIEQDSLREGLTFFCNHYIFPADRNRYALFADPETMLLRLKQVKGGILRDYFRVQQEDQPGDYYWKEFDLILVPGMKEELVLSCIKNAEPTQDNSAIVCALTGEGNVL